MCLPRLTTSRDELPAELDVTAYVGMYTFPDIKRRRWPGYIYLAVATVCFVLWATNRGGDPVLVNKGFLLTAVALFLIGAYHLAAAWPLAVRDSDALVAAVRQVGFAVGHASAQLGWRGLRSRPTWRISSTPTRSPPPGGGWYSSMVSRATFCPTSSRTTPRTGRTTIPRKVLVRRLSGGGTHRNFGYILGHARRRRSPHPSDTRPGGKAPRTVRHYLDEVCPTGPVRGGHGGRRTEIVAAPSGTFARDAVLHEGMGKRRVGRC